MGAGGHEDKRGGHAYPREEAYDLGMRKAAELYHTKRGGGIYHMPLEYY